MYMTKYILHGGATSNKTENNRKYFFEMIKDVPKDAAVLCVYFASDKELWLKKFEQDKTNFSSALPESNFSFILADDKISILVEQIKKADVVYFRGGKTDMLAEVLVKVNNLGELLKGKVVSGSSAGVYVLSKYYYSHNKGGIFSGLGVLPIKTICHYDVGKKDKLEELKKHGEELEVYTIPEEKFIVIEA